MGREELKTRSIGHCAKLEEDAMLIGREAGVSGHVLDISGKKTQLRVLLDTGAVLSVIPIETWNKDDLMDSRIRLSAAHKGALRVLGRTPIIALNLKNTEAVSGDLPTKTVKAVTQVRSAMEAEVGNSPKINYEKASA